MNGCYDCNSESDGRHGKNIVSSLKSEICHNQHHPTTLEFCFQEESPKRFFLSSKYHGVCLISFMDIIETKEIIIMNSYKED